MGNWYQKLKGFLAGGNMFHILYTYLIANIIACGFCLMDTADKAVTIIVSGVLAWIVGVFVECFDGYYGIKQLDKTGVQGNIFSTKDLLYDAIGAVLAMVTIGIMVI